VSSDPRFLSCRATLAGDINQARRFAQVFAELMPTLQLVPARMILGKKHRAFDAAAFRDFVASDEAFGAVVWRRAPEGSLAHLYLRVGDAPALTEYTDRASAFVVPAAARDTLIELVRRLADCFGVVSANISGHTTHAYAEKESLREGVAGTWDQATLARIAWDASHWKAARTKLIRLSPITVIGPAIWATLPPMPAFDPMPRITDLGACKLLTAWPTLCEPRESGLPPRHPRAAPLALAIHDPEPRRSRRQRSAAVADRQAICLRSTLRSSG
jgi:hypothetical protein